MDVSMKILHILLGLVVLLASSKQLTHKYHGWGTAILVLVFAVIIQIYARKPVV
jgi:hypothetical protein